MRRMMLMVTVALVMAAMMVASALPVFAAANSNANERGEGVSSAAPLNKERFGEYQSFQAQNDSSFNERVKREAQTR